MSAYLLRDESGAVIGMGCGPMPPTEGDLAVVREFAAWLKAGKPLCEICGQPTTTGTPPECTACGIAEEARQKRGADR